MLYATIRRTFQGAYEISGEGERRSYMGYTYLTW